jgi:hypothetical protein
MRRGDTKNEGKKRRGKKGKKGKIEKVRRKRIKEQREKEASWISSSRQESIENV